ncbi:prepilin-type N-terminal cleavage/methylation domain-containing protein [Nibricoccus sp. IMCC34717]|uniref:prepilin-type N-terminal cleavage/methylation domain-containing protein n=1 Tax=Nibricoccus sp. IMCC34717 TaxID=3034021 RepID=UPI00384CA39F
MSTPRKAFTLLEVLLALAVFALFATVIAGGYLNVLRAYQAADNDGLEESRLRFARIEFLNTKTRDDAENGGDFTDGDVRIAWKAEIEPTAVPDVFRAVFSCRQELPGRPKPIVSTEVLWLRRPAWSRPDERGPVELRFREAVRKHLDAVEGRR